MKKTFWSSVADLWCHLIHPDPMWPVHGFYRCPACHRQYAVAWEVNPVAIVVDHDSPFWRTESPQARGEQTVRSAW